MLEKHGLGEVHNRIYRETPAMTGGLPKFELSSFQNILKIGLIQSSIGFQNFLRTKRNVQMSEKNSGLNFPKTYS